MKISTIKLNKSLDKSTHGSIKKKKDRSALTGTLITFCIIIAIWYRLSLIYSPLVVPSPALTINTFCNIVQSNQFIGTILITLERLLKGIIISVLTGTILGILIGINKIFKSVFEPLVYLIQSIPPILLMTLIMIWFGLDGEATVFIVFFVSVPVMAINIKEGFEDIDPKLLEMGRAFKFTKTKMITQIVIPSLKSYFKSGLLIVVGFGWKMVIMGEVLSSCNGLGAQIYDARMNMQTNKVFAWGLLVIIFSFLLQKVTAIVADLKPSRRKYNDIKN